MRCAHGGLDDLRERARGRRAAGRDRPRAVHRGGLPRRHAPRHARPRRRGDGAHPRRRLARRDRAGCTGAASASGSCTSARPTRSDGRYRFWGGLAVGVVDGGEGLIAQHRAAAERAGIEVRDDAPVERAPARRRGRSRGGRRAARSCARGRRRPGGGRLRVQPADARRLPRPELGRGEGARHAAQHRRGAARRARRTARRPYGHWSGCHAIQWDAGAPPTGDLRAHQPLLAPVVSARHRRQRATASASSTRAPTSATTRTPSTAPRCCASREGIAAQIFDARTGRDAAHDRLRGAGRHARRRGHDRRARRAARHRPGAARAHRARVQRRRSQPGEFDPSIKDGKRTEGIDAAEVQLGAADRAAAVHGVPGHLRDHVHVRRRCAWTSTRACSTRRARRCPGLFAAGELVGGLFFHNYPGGSGLTAGTVVRAARRVRGGRPVGSLLPA